MSGTRVWVIDDDRSIRWVLERALTQAGMTVAVFENGAEAMAQLAIEQPDVVVSDIRMPEMDGLSLLENISARFPKLPVIIMTAYSDLESTVSAYQGGAFEYLPKPFDVDEAVALVRRALGRHKDSQDWQAPDEDSGSAVGGIVGSAPAMQEVFRAIGRLSRSNITVLITGESGTGKELVARALHRHSPRTNAPFIALNTAAIPKELLESELFGHERGAFTGAQSQRLGRFEQADGGTLFLDEIGDMPPELQTRLLRVLADGEFYRVGGHVPIRVDVRIIAATHQDLESRVRAGTFREDLYHRLNVIRVHVPALRDRREDILPLLRHFLSVAAEELGATTKTLGGDVEQYLTAMAWPGNVRQLENLCRWLTVMASGNAIQLSDLPPELREGPQPEVGDDDWQSQLRRWAERHLAAGKNGLLDDAVPRFEQIMIETALSASGGRRQDAARLLGWGRNTLTRKIKEHGLQFDD
jgi:two-component system nitrogen regulation response regulator GlnG